MKIIADISEDVYTRLFDSGIQDNEIAVDDVCEMARALRIGTPLDSVRAEIDQLPLVLLAGNYHIDKDYVMEILDRIGAAESEETNMSKDEAIKILVAIRSDAIQGTCYVTESSAEALEMAIEALKRQLQER